ncbi:hypothetical protein [Thiorhodovibrio frisius]|nr:hypothetical protein [Thiorhodovibrio frisius]
MHRIKGFSEDSLIAYIEFWGVMQAIVIQQDSISELFNAIIGKSLNTKILKNWQKLRLFRNTCAGHPARKDRPKTLPLTRTFMGRTFGNYDEFIYEKWESPNEITHPRVNLSALIDSYEKEAAEILNLILSKMKKQWPKS